MPPCVRSATLRSDWTTASVRSRRGSPRASAAAAVRIALGREHHDHRHLRFGGHAPEERFEVRLQRARGRKAG
jgi:hypothetical protein